MIRLLWLLIALACLAGCSVTEDWTRYAADGKTPVEHATRKYPGYYEFRPDGTRTVPGVVVEAGERTAGKVIEKGPEMAGVVMDHFSRAATQAEKP